MLSNGIDHIYNSRKQLKYRYPRFMELIHGKFWRFLRYILLFICSKDKLYIFYASTKTIIFHGKPIKFHMVFIYGHKFLLPFHYHHHELAIIAFAHKLLSSNCYFIDTFTTFEFATSLFFYDLSIRQIASLSSFIHSIITLKRSF